MNTIRRAALSTRLHPQCPSLRPVSLRRYTPASQASDKAVALSPPPLPTKPKRKRTRHTSTEEVSISWDLVLLVIVPISIIGLGISDLSGSARDLNRQNVIREARNKVLDKHTEFQVIDALDEVRTRLSVEAERARTRNLTPGSSVPTFKGDSDLIKMLAKLTEKERAVLRACLTGLVETKHLGSGAGRSTEEMSISEKWQEEAGRLYWR